MRSHKQHKREGRKEGRKDWHVTDGTAGEIK